jgi:hypothetical protein
MDAYGFPIGLFATNRWVTGETWYPCSDVIGMLDRFAIDHAFPSWPVNRWISAMVVLFRPHIEHLLRHRDRVIDAWQRGRPADDVFENRALEMTGYLPISVDEWLAELSAAEGGASDDRGSATIGRAGTLGTQTDTFGHPASRLRF